MQSHYLDILHYQVVAFNDYIYAFHFVDINEKNIDAKINIKINIDGNY